MKKHFKFILILFSILSLNLHSQVINSDITKSSITISGTSNLHDWDCKATKINIDGLITNDRLNKLNVTIPVKSIKSKDRSMDSKIYDTFNSEKYPNIYFKLTNTIVYSEVENDVYSTLIGNLIINNVTKQITLKVIGKKISENVIEFKGNLDLKMTDFNMTPPVALLGTMKVGDKVKLKISVQIIKDKF